MNDKVRQAIAEGEAILAERKRQDQLKYEQELREAVQRKARARELAVVWVEEKLPGIIRDETAKGNRQYTTSDSADAQAAREAGFKVTEYWHERSMDEGIDWGSYWAYTIYW
jgi:hypothetical protein